MAYVVIDLNARTDYDRVYAGFAEVHGAITVGDTTTVSEPEAGIVGEAVVERIDSRKGLVYLDVKWDSLRGGSPDNEKREFSALTTGTSFIDLAFGDSVHLEGGAYFKFAPERFGRLISDNSRGSRAATIPS